MTKLSGDSPAFPCELPVAGNSRIGYDGHPGIPIRLELAKAAMQGILGALAHSNDTRITDDLIAKRSLAMSDALLAEYNKGASNER